MERMIVIGRLKYVKTSHWIEWSFGRTSLSSTDHISFNGGMEECTEEGIGLWWGTNIIKDFSIRVMEPGNLILYFSVTVAWPFPDLLSSLEDVSIQYPRLSSRSGETEKCFTSDYIVHRKNYFTIPILSQFSIRPSVQWRRNEMCLHWPIRSFERRFYPMKLSCLLGDTSIETVDLIRLKLWSLCMKLKEI